MIRLSREVYPGAEREFGMGVRNGGQEWGSEWGSGCHHYYFRYDPLENVFVRAGDFHQL